MPDAHNIFIGDVDEFLEEARSRIANGWMVESVEFDHVVFQIRDEFNDSTNVTIWANTNDDLEKLLEDLWESMMPVQTVAFRELVEAAMKIRAIGA